MPCRPFSFPTFPEEHEAIVSAAHIRTAARLFSLTLVFVATLASCAEQDEVWGTPRETFAERLERGNYDFLRHLDYRDLDLEEVTRLRPGAAFYLAEIYGELELDRMRRRMLAVELEHGSDPWRRRAAAELLAQLEAEERYEELEDAADTALGLYPNEEAFLYSRFLALYEQEADAELRDALESDSSALRDFLDADPWDPRRQEVELWRAVTAFRLREEGWADQVRRFFLDLPAAPQHSRLYVFLIARSAAQEPFSGAELSLFSAKARVAEGDFDEAARTFLALAADAEEPLESAGLPVSAWLARDMGHAFLRAGYRSRGVGMLEGYASAAEDPIVRARASEYAGRLYRAGGNAQAAIERFDAAMSDYTDPSDRRRVLWNIVDARTVLEPRIAAKDLRRYADAAYGEWYFDRMLDGLASELVRRGAWEALAGAGEVLEEVGFHGIAERFLYIAAEAALQGRYQASSAADGGASPRELLGRIDTDPYYRLLAAVRLGRTDTLVSSASDETSGETSGETSVGDDGSDGGAAASDTEAIVGGYLSVGLHVHAYETAMAESDDMSVAAIEDVAERIQMHGLLIESLRLMARARSRDEFVLTPRAARILYPRAYSIAMEDVTEVEGIDLPVFYGLVREESHFSADIESHAGATGLAQLMPATAADMARRMRIEDPDLTDPATNLSIGGYYLSYLLGRFDGDLLSALAAYNGGQGRVRRWVRENGALSGPLFHEAMPIRETRHYIRKVLVAAAYYGEIYDQRTIAETVRLFFPDMKTIPEEST
ncbi:MAG: transglycosylase SLT domain-containing protein [Spirochaetes bacterium]|nr:transglycosylase SLT domain-containing protein [Spirochaetota bacterium]